MTEQEVLELRTIEDVRRLSHLAFAGRFITGREISHIFKICDALWLHSGNPDDPHAELTSRKSEDGKVIPGKCSDGFVDVLRVIRFTNLCKLFAYHIVRRLNMPVPDWVVGSDHAGAALSHSVATLFHAQHDFTEKGPDKQQLWERFVIKPDEMVLQVEELVTTTGTLQAVRDGIRTGNPNPVRFSPVVCTLVHRSDVYDIEGSPISFLVHYDISTWEPDKCPLCAKGSKRLRPKQNWAELTKR